MIQKGTILIDFNFPPDSGHHVIIVGERSSVSDRSSAYNNSVVVYSYSHSDTSRDRYVYSFDYVKKYCKPVHPMFLELYV